MNPLKIEGTPCKHPQYVLDAEERAVHCSTCGFVFDAFEVLLLESQRNAKHEGFLSRARGELGSLHKQVEEQHKLLLRTKRSVDHESRKVNRLIEQRKALEHEVEAQESARGSPDPGGFQLDLASADAAARFQS